MTPIERIREKLQTLQQEGWEQYTEFFGVKHHRFLLNPCLSPAEIATFEEQHQITLPEEYRQFLLHIGNGGAGPFYGLDSLHQWDAFVAYFTDAPMPTNFLSAQPLLTPAYHMQKEQWKVVRRAYPRDAYRGCIALCLQGCTYYGLLMVSGEHAGRIVYVDGDPQPPYFVSPVGFLAWYEGWLDELLSGKPSSWYAMD